MESLWTRASLPVVVDPGPGPAFLALLNQTLAESDGFLQGISANASAVPGGFQFVADAAISAQLTDAQPASAARRFRRRDLNQTMADAQNSARSINRRINAVRAVGSARTSPGSRILPPCSTNCKRC